MSKGLFISFEGIDGSGKTTQIEFLANRLVEKSYRVLKTFEPGGSQIGKDVRNLLLKDCHSITPLTETLLLFADRYEHQQNVIIPALNEGKIVISDRTNDSTIAYQAFGKGVDKKMILEFQTSYLIQPHVTFLLKLPPARLSSRIQQRSADGEVNKFDQYHTDFFHRVCEGYEYIERAFPERVKSIDADRAPDIIFQDILTHVYAIL